MSTQPELLRILTVENDKAFTFITAFLLKMFLYIG
jgi:hypothetical protein